MATVTLQVSLAGPTDNGGSCRVLYEVSNADGVSPEIFVVKQKQPEYHGAEPVQVWQHVAYADEMTNVPLSIDPTVHTDQFIRKAAVTLQYTSLEAANTAIQSIRSQIQRLVNELNILSTYETTNTYIISSTN